MEIYAVDDDMLYLRLLSNQIRKNTSYPVEIFTNGEDCLAHYKANNPRPGKFCLVILDYMLSTREQKDAKDGLKILDELIGYDKNAKVLLLSGVPDVNIAKAAIEKGALNYIPKNENSFIRIHNTIQHLISERKLIRRKQQSMFLLWLFLSMLGLGLITLLLVYLRYPGWIYYGLG